MNPVKSLTRPLLPLGLALVLIGLPNAGTTIRAHDPQLTLYGAGTATVDGVMSPGEWDNAGQASFQAVLPALEGGGTTPATLYVMNDSVNLYIAVRVQRPSLDISSVDLEFDNDHDGVREAGDDVIHMNAYPNFPSAFFDSVRLPCPGDPPDLLTCAPNDTAVGGSSDGEGVATNDGTDSTYELSHPLNSPDDSFDVGLSAGTVVGFRLSVRFIVGSWPDGFGDTYVPINCVECADEFGDILITPLASAIDIKPNSTLNTIQKSNLGVIPVAILSNATFSAPVGIDPMTLTFGRTGSEPSLSHYSVADVNLDGFVDLIAHFHTLLTGFQTGDTVGILKGPRTDGTPFVGTDSVRIVN